jgi:hypothetical protein
VLAFILLEYKKNENDQCEKNKEKDQSMTPNSLRSHKSPAARPRYQRSARTSVIRMKKM